MLSTTDNLLRILNAMFLIICMAFVSALLNTQNENSGRVNYCMFTAAFGLTTDSFYGIAANFWEPLTWPLVLVCLDFLNFAFTFSAGTVIAVGIRAHSCKNESYRSGNKIIQGDENRCRITQALVAFLYFSMFIFIVKLTMSIITLIQNGAFSSATSRFYGRRRRNNASAGVPTDMSGVPSVSYTHLTLPTKA